MLVIDALYKLLREKNVDARLLYTPSCVLGMEEEEIARILNTTKYSYNYDTQTFYMTIAEVCGCISIIVMEPGKTKSDYLSEEECARFVGKAYGDSPEEIQYAISTRDELLLRLDYSKNNEENVNKFIQIVTERFGKID